MDENKAREELLKQAQKRKDDAVLKATNEVVLGEYKLEEAKKELQAVLDSDLLKYQTEGFIRYGTGELLGTRSTYTIS